MHVNFTSAGQRRKVEVPSYVKALKPLEPRVSAMNDKPRARSKMLALTPVKKDFAAVRSPKHGFDKWSEQRYALGLRSGPTRKHAFLPSGYVPMLMPVLGM